MFCGNCGTRLPDDAVFCPECGEKVANQSQGVDILAQKEDVSSNQNPSKSKIRKNIKAVISLAVGAAVVIVVIYSLLKHPISDLKDMVFEDYGDITFGEAIEENVRNTSWESEKVDSTHYIVTVSGFIPDTYSNIELSFDLNYADDCVYASAKEVVLDGDYYDDSFSISFVMGVIYGS